MGHDSSATRRTSGVRTLRNGAPARALTIPSSPMAVRSSAVPCQRVTYGASDGARTKTTASNMTPMRCDAAAAATGRFTSSERRTQWLWSAIARIDSSPKVNATRRSGVATNAWAATTSSVPAIAARTRRKATTASSDSRTRDTDALISRIPHVSAPDSTTMPRYVITAVAKIQTPNPAGPRTRARYAVSTKPSACAVVSPTNNTPTLRATRRRPVVTERGPRGMLQVASPEASQMRRRLTIYGIHAHGMPVTSTGATAARRRGRSGQLPIDGRHRRGYPRPAKALRPRTTTNAQAVGIRDRSLDPGGDGARVEGIDQHRCVSTHLRQRACARGDDGAAGSHRLDDRYTEALVQRWDDQTARARVESVQCPVGDAAQ